MSDFVVVIPARYDSSRFPGKMLADICGQPMIVRSVQQALKSNASQVFVAIDDERIGEALQSLECEVVMTRKGHASGSDRLAEVVDKREIEAQRIVVNVQGDEPLIDPEHIDLVAQTLAESPCASMATLATKITDELEFQDPNVVKVVLNNSNHALYFSRASIPHRRAGDQQADSLPLHHIGVYAYRAEFLSQFPKLDVSPLEQVEKLEQLRALHHGFNIAVATIDNYQGLGVDTPEDLERAISVFEQRQVNIGKSK